MSRFEYRVCWRREHDKLMRFSLYQTVESARDFAEQLEGAGMSDVPILGSKVVEVFIERRVVGEWEAM